MIYNAGTISFSGNTVTGSGTSFTSPSSQIRIGQTLLVASNPVQLVQITAINSATSLTVTPAASPAVSDQRYGIFVTDSLSVDGLAQSISQLIKEYDENIGAWEAFATTNANQSVTVTINGQSAIIPAIGKLLQKGSNGALPVAGGGTGATDAAGARKNIGFVNETLPVALGGTGAKDATGARKNIGIVNTDGVVPLSLGGTGANSAWDATKNLKTMRTIERRFGPGDEPRDAGWSNSIGFVVGQNIIGANGLFVDFTSFDQTARMQLIGYYSDSQGKSGVGYNLWNPNLQNWYAFTTLRDSRNTTVHGNGFIKNASPVVRLVSDPDNMPTGFLENFTLNGCLAFNDEAAGTSGERVAAGIYKVRGATGLHSDGWTIEVPQDANGNRLCFVETSTDDDGTITVSVFKRRFDIDTAMIVAGEPMDIPAGRWIDLRLEMPESSVFHQKLKSSEDGGGAGSKDG